ncbi:CKLF-like MARVEL transmembrane domain-containing protein 5 [Bombina bombina]|uniref:CKLF-like MARVEL transmembrane domain-containing protein 5 n=1 Tax=Bombina bombina TaxID=8345 RepID=UPI00235AFB58|nr:CKLF-like MARVEL transmembrane domain-containing protein 5 [Bombina bombina]
MSEQEGDGSPSGFTLDKEFLNSLKGRILLAELVLCFVVFICFAASISSYLAAPLLEFIITLIFLIIFSSRYHFRLTSLNWPCTDFLRCVSAAVIFLVISIVAAARSSGEGGAITAALFGFILVCVFSYDAFNIYKANLLEQAAGENQGGAAV